MIPVTRDLPTAGANDAPASPPVTVEAIELLLAATNESETTHAVLASLFADHLTSDLVQHADRKLLARAIALLATDDELGVHVNDWLAQEHEIVCACCRAKAQSKAVAS